MRALYAPLAGGLLLAAAVAGCDADDNDSLLQPAPLDSAQVVALESSPPRYTVEIVAVLPDGCSSPGGHSVKRDGTSFQVDVLNRHTGTQQCTAVAALYRLTVSLDGDFEIGTPYTVKVNDRSLTFTLE
ncbi:MAG TPA: hypothetical protein VFX19_07495 [Dehalococcoidia bacterium]|jgi:hypothetical protein|nr:hypothetical protein [Dehalococcoidia bacterium]